MDKEQLKKILEPVKKVCLSHYYCDKCPFYSKTHHCSMKRRLICDYMNSDPINNASKLYIKILEKCVHGFCGKESCNFCSENCTLKKIPKKWDFDELP